MEVDILIDKITNCLIDTRTGEEVATEYRKRGTPIRPKDYKGGNLEYHRESHFRKQRFERVSVFLCGKFQVKAINRKLILHMS